MSLSVISGGQTGADVAGLWVAKIFNIPTGGWAPKDFITTSGKHPEMAETFGLKEHAESYRARTIENLKSSDLTIVCSSRFEGGTKLTVNQCTKLKKNLYVLPLDPEDLETSLKSPVFDQIIWFIQKKLPLGDFTLNVAGNSTRSSPRAFEFTFKACFKIFKELGYVNQNGITEDSWVDYQDTWS
jgi:hypothetical protein